MSGGAWRGSFDVRERCCAALYFVLVALHQWLGSWEAEQLAGLWPSSKTK